MLGISLYPGLMTRNSIDLHLKQVKEYDIHLLFVSLHVPEAYKGRDEGQILNEFEYILEKLDGHDIKIIIDVSKNYFNLVKSHKNKIYVLRLDFGFSDYEIVEIVKQSEFKVALNASTITESQMKNLIQLGLDLNKIEMSHNFYPKPNTGLSYSFFREKNSYFKSLGLPINAFISNFQNKREAIGMGLPTLEVHRNLPLLISYQDISLEDVDDIIISDHLNSDTLDHFKELQKDKHLICANLIYPKDIIPKIYLQLLSNTHTSRTDASESLIRSEESRAYFSKLISDEDIDEIRIYQKRLEEDILNNFNNKYAVIVDNEKYLRYQGELNICIKNIPLDGKSDIIAYCNISSVLINKIKPGDKFRFLF